jgi:dimethylamine/trimethylamine dehydrogenase
LNRNPRYDILFEPVKIGPVTAPNRFYCTPHALGTGNQMPNTRAAMREVRAEGGWGVVNTGYCSIHPSSDDAPLPYCRLWNDDDIAVHELMVDAVHRHGSLAGVELWHGGGGTGNKMTRMPLMSVSGISSNSTYPGWINLARSRPMDKQDIREFRQWHVDAAVRAKSAGFDIVYVYAGMNFGPYQFLLPWLNKRSDEYGGSLENRVRLTREIIEDMKAAVGDSCAIALRFSTDELLNVPGETLQSEAHEIISTLSDVPDLWDLKSSDWVVETTSARFAEQGAQEPWVSFAKSLTSKPVVGVGRFTSPDVMVSQVKRGVLDLVGAARPSIADPFLPNKINEGREDEIRECIGCNICVSGYHDSVPIRCTQNPTMGEEWRRGWHPERIPSGDSATSVLVVGAGPAGLECARALGQRGFAVTLAEAREALGGRASIESSLPGLASWARVRDYRSNLLQAMGNVDIYPGNELSSEDIIDFNCDHAVIATGAKWTREILSERGIPVAGFGGEAIFTPDDILAGALPEGPVLIYDFDHYYMGACIAELLAARGCEVTIATPANAISAWTFMNNDLGNIRRRIIDLGIATEIDHRLTGFSDGVAELTSVYRDTDRKNLTAASLVVVGVRKSCDDLFEELQSNSDRLADASIRSLRRIGDCRVPGTIAHAVYSGHEWARLIDADKNEDPANAIKWERPNLDKP